MKIKASILFWIDFALFVLLCALVTTGVILRWVLPPGSGGGGGGWRGGRSAAHSASKQLMDLSRHEWGDVHLWIAIALVGLIIVHLVLHWGWLKTCIPRYLLYGTRRTSRATSPSAPKRSE